MSGLIILHGCRTIQLTRGFNTLIDESDFDKVGHFKWHVQKSRLTYYATRTQRTDCRRILQAMHRIIINAKIGIMVDHRNGDGLDNRRENLRICTNVQNNRNRRRAKGRSRFKGVNIREMRHGIRFRAYFCIGNGKLKHLGTFDTEEAAAHAYDEAAIEHYGEFAKTNADIHGNY